MYSIIISVSQHAYLSYGNEPCVYTLNQEIISIVNAVSETSASADSNFNQWLTKVEKSALELQMYQEFMQICLKVL